MKTWTLFLTLALLSCQNSGHVSSDAAPPQPAAVSAPEAGPIVVEDAGAWSVHFSPNGGCQDAIVAFIGTAHQYVHIMAYGFTEEAVANALIAKKAEGHGMEVIAVLDKSDKTAKNSMAPVLKNGNVPVFIDSKHAIMHDKYIVVDGLAIETGSYNFTTSAEKNNAENCLIEHDPMKAKAYEANFQVHKGHSDPLPFTN